jgi:hypothetical protein
MGGCFERKDVLLILYVLYGEFTQVQVIPVDSLERSKGEG